MWGPTPWPGSWEEGGMGWYLRSLRRCWGGRKVGFGDEVGLGWEASDWGFEGEEEDEVVGFRKNLSKVPTGMEKASSTRCTKR